MQNEPNFLESQMNVNKVLTKDYENKSNWTLGENEPKTNPIKANKMPKQTQNKPNQTQSPHPGVPGFGLKSQSFCKRAGNWLIWRIVYCAAAPDSCEDSEYKPAGRIMRMVKKPNLFGAIKSFFSLSAT